MKLYVSQSEADTGKITQANASICTTQRTFWTMEQKKKRCAFYSTCLEGIEAKRKLKFGVYSE